MAETAQNNSTVDTLKNELDKLRTQIEGMVKNFETTKGEKASDLVDKLSAELEKLKSGAKNQAGRLYDAGQDGVEELGEHVRKNPLLSLAIAFGAGCIISCLFRHLK